MPAFLKEQRSGPGIFLTTAWVWQAAGLAWVPDPDGPQTAALASPRWSILRAKCKMQMNLGHRQPQK